MSLRMLEFLTYLCSGVVCLVLGIVLLGVRTDYIDGEKDFRKVKSFVAYAAFLDVLKDILIILMQSYRADYFLANWFFVPFVLWLQMTMGACSLLAMFRSKEVCKSNLILFCLPIVLLMTAHYSIYFIFYYVPGNFISSYQEFLGTGLSYGICGALYSLALVELAALGIWLVRDVRKYNRLLDGFCSGIDLKRGRHLNITIYAYFVYFTLGGLNLILHNVVTSIVLQCTTTILFLLFVVPLINLQTLFVKVGPIYNLDNHPRPDGGTVEAHVKVNADVSAPGAAPSSKHVVMVEAGSKKRTGDIVRAWVDSDTRPYLQEGLTLPVAAEEMGLSPRLLSDYLNNIQGVNFNAWINGLRIEEVKKLLIEDEDAVLMDIAMKTGYSDASSMSKIFKKVTGMTPTLFRASGAARCPSDSATPGRR